MKRENRYLVVKNSDMDKCLTTTEYDILYHILKKVRDYRRSTNREPYKNYVVVSEDWPMYEDTWDAIEKWVDAPVESYDMADDALDLGKE